MFKPNNYHYHFMGIGGVGMSALAQVLLRQGYKVSGCDCGSNDALTNFKAKGVKIDASHDAKHLHGVDVLVYSSSIKESNQELIQARNARCEVMHRSELLADISKTQDFVAICGTHGKTSTTALVGRVFEYAKKDPTILVGGHVNKIGGNVLIGESPLMIAEADESDSSFLNYAPKKILVTNIDDDHMDHFLNRNEIIRTFSKFISKLKPDGEWFVYDQCEGLEALISDNSQIDRPVLFGSTHLADYRCVDLRVLDESNQEFTIVKNQNVLGKIRMSMMGKHQAINATGACALAIESGIGFKTIQEALLDFDGASRRFDILHHSNSVVVDDYAHHPTEIRATLETAKEVFSLPICAIFQPHRYSRFSHHITDFSSSFEIADKLIITDIYAASEKNKLQVSDPAIFSKFTSKHGNVHYITYDEITPYLIDQNQKPMVYLFMGAGDINIKSHELKEYYESAARK